MLRARMGVRGSDPYQLIALEALCHSLVCQSGLADRCAIPSFDRLRLRRPLTLASAYAATNAGALKSSCLVSKAQTILAILLASATDTSMRGLRANMLSSQEPAGAPNLQACRTIELPPMISKRLIVRSPIFEMEPSFGLPPVECCNGVRPSQAAKSRPFAKVSMGGASERIAAAGTGPMSGMVINLDRNEAHAGMLRSFAEMFRLQIASPFPLGKSEGTRENPKPLKH